MSEDTFRKFLMEEKQLSERSVDNYCSYIRSLVNAYELTNWAELIESKEKSQEYIGKLVGLPMRLPVRSARCYRRAICLLYEFSHGEELDKASIPRWATESADNVDFVQGFKINHPEYFSDNWYQVLIVSDPREWLELICELNGSSFDGIRRWAFRGQGDAQWGLETSLGRAANYGDDDDLIKGRWLRLFEKETMWEFGRESAKRMEYRGLEGIDLLSLVQHYGGKTRLLDFTLAPLLALYMAVDQNKTDFAKIQGYSGLSSEEKAKLARPDFAVWAVDLSRIGNSSKRYGDALTGSKDTKQGTVEEELALVEEMLKNGNAECKGMHVVFPRTCNDRLSAQDGLFLMPKSLDCSFERNFKSELATGSGSPKVFSGRFLSEYQAIETEHDQPRLIKFVFPSSSLESVMRLLSEANVTAKHVYPDLVGLGRYVSNIIEQHCQVRR